MLLNFVNKYNLVSTNKYGFKKKCSTEIALVKVMNHIISSFNSGVKCMTIFLDSVKAFDSVPHHILLERLHYRGIIGLPNDFIKSFLHSRQQQVRYLHTVSILNVHRTIKAHVFFHINFM